MRNISQTLAAVGSFLLLLAGTASAADMRQFPPSTPVLENAPLLVDEFSSGWYLRGDVGYRWNKADDVIDLGPTPSVQDNSLADSWTLGGGVGYKWEWFRTDLTVDYAFKSKFSSNSPLVGNDITANIDSVTGLVNLYGDLGTWWGFTPYVGGGIGFARLQVGDFRVKSSGVDDAPSNDKWNFAWAYMAGVSYRVTGNYLIDVGYRHVNMGDVKSGTDSIGDRVLFKKMSSDEVRVGFRYVLD